MHIKHLGLITITLLAGCEKPVESPPPPRPALVMEVGARAPATTMSLVGEVRPRYESQQSFRLNGKIIARTVEVGTHVKKGQLLARLDAADTRLNTAAAQADVNAAKANYALALAEVTRQRQLFAKKFISSSALDSHEAAFETAQAKLAQANAQANVSGHQTRYTQLTADRDGVITWIHAEPGQVVQAGETVVHIAGTEAIDVVVTVPESRMTEIKPTMPVMIKLWANRQTSYPGVVREIAPAAVSATRAFTVRIDLNGADDAVKLGMTAGVRFSQSASESTAGFLVPSTALTELEGKPGVWVITKANKAEPREVVAGPFREDGVVISKGLKAGERIAVAGVHTLYKDQSVTPVYADTLAP